jgi:lipopolysaccharide/colanic/teichoic acid biosynthesis glycosyltransferase
MVVPGASGRRTGFSHPKTAAAETTNSAAVAGHATVGARVAAPATSARDTGDRVLKRLLDIVVAVVVLVAMLPLIAVVAVAIRLDSPGPVFYRCRRVGYRGADLDVLKFRKMRNGARGAALTAANDERFTRLGAFLAKTKIDEIPQLWNVLKGEMSLVGPRPEDAMFVVAVGDDFDRILTVKPGITGLSQLAFAKETDVLGRFGQAGGYVERVLPQKVKIDLLYAYNRTLAMDARILFWTVIAVVLRRDVSVGRETGALRIRRRTSAPELELAIAGSAR